MSKAKAVTVKGEKKIKALKRLAAEILGRDGDRGAIFWDLLGDEGVLGETGYYISEGFASLRLRRWRWPVLLTKGEMVFDSHVAWCSMQGKCRTKLRMVELAESHRFAGLKAVNLRTLPKPEMLLVLYQWERALWRALWISEGQTRERICKFLMAYQDEQTGEIKGLRHRDIALFTRCGREHATRIIKELEEQGVIETKKRWLRVIDCERLAALAGMESDGSDES